MTWLSWLADAQALTPHGFCLLWQPALLWLDAGADAAIMLAYFSIPLTLAWFARRRPDLPHRWIAALFVAFIVACGITHGLSILTLWVAAYRLEAAGKLVTAGLSIVTAAAMYPLVPKLLALPSPGQMARLNDELRTSLAEQQETAARLRHSEQRLQQSHDLLEQHVAERTAALEASTASLRRSQSLLHRMSAIAGVGGWQYDLASRSSALSEETHRILGLAPGPEWTHEPILALAGRLLAPEARPVIREAVRRTLAGQGGWDLELPCIRGDGRAIWLRTVGSLELADGQPVGLTGAVQDVTERRAERQALQHALERLSLATESCGIGIWDWDLMQDVLVCNRQMYALYDLEPQAVFSVDLWRRHLHPDDLAATEQALRDAIAGGRPYDCEFRAVWRDGGVRHIHAVGRVSRDALGRALRMVGTNVDVTERRAAEAMRQARDAANRATRAKSEFLATMSHEIRSPMSGLMGVLELLRATRLDSEQSRMANMIHNSAAMLLAVLNDVLDFSKIEAGALSISPEPVALRPLLEAVVQPHAVSAMQKNLAFTLAVAPEVAEWVRTDPLRLRQILSNLLSNAVKFTAAGEIALRVEPVLPGATPGPIPGDTAPTDMPMLRFAVQDSGIGMTQPVLDKLFQPFTQADGSTTRNFGGTGLGLSISRKLAQLLDGTLQVASEPGQGSTFSLTLPLLAAAPASGQATAEAALPAMPDGRHVLVVDDDATIRWLSQRQLEKLGCRVDAADNGESGLQRLRQARYDLLLTDCHMPRMDGVALTRAVRAEADPVLRAIPVIGLTADVTEYQKQLCHESGMTELAIKPLTIERLALLLQRVLPAAAAAPPPPPSPPGAAPALRSIAFEDQIFLAIFPPGDPDGVAWLESFLDGAREDAAGLAALLAVPDTALDTAPDTALARTELRLLAHRAAGAAFSVGAMLLGEAARRLERAAEQDAPASLRTLCRELHHTLAGTADAIAGFVAAGREAALQPALQDS